MRRVSTIISLLIVCFSMSVLYGQSEDLDAGKMTNQLNLYGGADPWIQYYDGLLLSSDDNVAF